MAIRYLKMAFVVSIGLMALVYGLQNIVNLQAAHGVVAAVLGMAGHEYYPASIGPAITSPLLSGVALATIIAGEFAAGIIALKGAWDLWVKRRAESALFNASKTWALAGCGVGILVWLGLFGAIGGAWFQMWQTPLGAQSLSGAFQYAVSCALVFIIVSMDDA
jgi:predicted small integral membrane protein